MMPDFFSFFMLYAILTVMFSLICNINFVEISQFDSFFNSIMTVIDASLGNFSFTIFEPLNDDSVILIGQLVIVAMVVMFNILLLNLIIAILANTYNLFDSKSNGLFLSKILISRDEMLYDDSYGAFLTQMPPLNAIQLPFLVPALVFRYKSQTLLTINRIVMRAQYSIFMLLFFGIFAVVSVALIPLAYIIGVGDKLKTMKTQTSEKEKIMNNLVFLPLGPVILLLDCIADLYYFWMNNFRHTEGLKQIIIAKDKSYISHHSIKDIISLCRKYIVNKIKSTHTKQFVTTFAKKLKVH
jgi:hypothetical protein